MVEKVITELVIDASAATAGAAQYAAAMSKAATAANQTVAINTNAQAAINKTSISMTAGLGRQASQWQRIAAAADPVIKATNDLNKATSSSQAAMAKGFASQEQVTSVLGTYRARLDEATLAVQRGGKAHALNSGQISNLTYQLNDLAVMTASGQNPFVMLMQQGMQMAQIFGPGVGVGGAVKALGATFMSFITNPLNLMVVGLAVAAGAVKLLFDAISSGGKDAEETLKNQAELVKQIKDAYGETDDAAKKYKATLESLRFSERTVGEDLAKTLRSQLKELRGLAFGMSSDQAAGNFDDKNMQALLDATTKFTDSIRKGKGDVLAFNKEIAEIANRDASNKVLQEFARGLTESTEEATKTAKAIRDLNNTMLENMDVAGRLAASSNLAQQDMQNYGKFVNETTVSIKRLNEAHASELDAIGAKSPAQKAAAAAEEERISLIGEGITEGEKAARIANTGALAMAEAEYELSEATRARLRTMEDSVTAAQLELDVVGKSVGETTRLNTELELYQVAKQAAIDSGTLVSESEIAAIKETAAALGELNQRLVETQTLSDLKFDQSQIFRSATGQDVADTLRDIYGDDWQEHADEAIAKQIRINAVTDQLRDGLDSLKDAAVSTGISMVTAFVNGEASAQKMADTLLSLRDTLAEAAIKDLIAGNWISAGIKGIGAAVAHIFGNKAEDRAEEQAKEEARREREQAAAKAERQEMRELQKDYRELRREVRQMIKGEGTEFDQFLSNINSTWREFKKAAENAGESIDKIREKFKAFREDQIAEFRAGFVGDLQGMINDANGQGYINTVGDLIAEGMAQLQVAQQLGVSQDLVIQAYTAQIQSVINGAELTGDAFAQLIQQFPILAGQVQEFVEVVDPAIAAAEAVSDAQDALRRAHEAEAKALRDTISNLNQTIDRLTTFSEGIKALKNEFMIDQGLSPLSPEQRLAEARRQFMTARPEDLAAAARAYLSEAKEFHASSPEYARIFGEVQTVLDRRLGSADSQIAVAQQQLNATEDQLAALDEQVNVLLGIDDSVISVADAIRALHAALAAQAGIGMVAGGIVGNGRWNVDSVNARYAGGGTIGLAGGEFVTRASSVNSSTYPILAGINRTGVANDNGGFAQLSSTFATGLTGHAKAMMSGFSSLSTLLNAMVEQNAQMKNEIVRLRQDIDRSDRPRAKKVA